MTGYTTRVAVCPECGADLDDEGFTFWCPSCQENIPWNYAVLDDEDPDRSADD